MTLIEKLQALASAKRVTPIPSATAQETLDFIRVCADEREDAQKTAAIQARDFGIERAENVRQRAAIDAQLTELHSLILEKDAEIAAKNAEIAELTRKIGIMQAVQDRFSKKAVVR